MGWDDNVMDNPRTVTVTEDLVFTAVFAECEQCEVCEEYEECEVCEDCEICQECEVCPPSNITNIEDVESTSSATIQVYPNPAENILHVKLATAANGTLALYDVSGKVVFTQAINGTNVQLNIGMLMAGKYILRLVQNGIASAGVKVIN